jgi:hypothetical protein
LTAHFILTLIKLRTVNLSHLANAFENDVEAESNYKRLQRFFRFLEIDFDVIAQLVGRWLPDAPWIFGKERIAYLTADREFRGKEWLLYLALEKLDVRLRIPNNTRVFNKHRNRNKTLPVTRLFSIKVGEVMLLRQPRFIWGISVYLGATRTQDEHVIIISLAYAPNLIMPAAGKSKHFLVA